MKKLLFILCIVLVFSCSKEDDEDENYTKSDLQGVWNIEALEVQEEKVALTECDSQNSIHFIAEDVIITSAYNDDNECVVYNFEYGYTIEGNSVFIENSESSSFRYYAELISHNTIRFESTYIGDSQSLSIIYTYKKS